MDAPQGVPEMNESIIVTMGLGTSAFQRGLATTRNQLRTWSADVSRSISGRFNSLGKSMAAALSVGAVVSAVKSVVDYGAALKDVAEQANTSTDVVQGFSKVVSESGGSAEAAQAALIKLQQSMAGAASGNKGLVEAFEANNISLRNSKGEMRSTDEVLMDISDRMKSAKSYTEALGIAMEFFGSKMASKVAPALLQGSESLKQLMDQTSKLSAEDLAAIDALSDSMTNLATELKIAGGVALVFWGGVLDKAKQVKNVFTPIVDVLDKITRFLNKPVKLPFIPGLFPPNGNGDGLVNILPPDKWANAGLPTDDQTAALASMPYSKGWREKLKRFAPNMEGVSTGSLIGPPSIQTALSPAAIMQRTGWLRAFLDIQNKFGPNGLPKIPIPRVDVPKFDPKTGKRIPSDAEKSAMEKLNEKEERGLRVRPIMGR